MSLLPKYNKKLSLEENIEAVRQVLEHKFTSEYGVWREIVNKLNKHIVEYVEGYEQPGDKVLPYTYDEFCSSYMTYVENYIRSNGGDYDLRDTVNLISIMATERLPEWMVKNIQAIQLERASVEEEQEAMDSEAKLSIDELRAVDEFTDFAVMPEDQPRQQHLPAAWRVELAVVTDYELIEGVDPTGDDTYQDDDAPHNGDDDDFVDDF